MLVILKRSLSIFCVLSMVVVQGAQAAPVYFDQFGSGKLQGPRGIAVDNNGKIYVADTGNHRVQIFDNDAPNYTHLKTLDGGPTETFEGPRSIAVDNNGKIYVADIGTYYNHIKIFDNDAPDYTHLKTFGSFGTTVGEINFPEGIAVDNNGKIYVADTGNSRIQIFGNDAQNYT